jgi:hypothetical protein
MYIVGAILYQRQQKTILKWQRSSGENSGPVQVLCAHAMVAICHVAMRHQMRLRKHHPVTSNDHT